MTMHISVFRLELNTYTNRNFSLTLHLIQPTFPLLVLFTYNKINSSETCLEPTSLGRAFVFRIDRCSVYSC